MLTLNDSLPNPFFMGSFSSYHLLYTHVLREVVLGLSLSWYLLRLGQDHLLLWLWFPSNADKSQICICKASLRGWMSDLNVLSHIWSLRLAVSQAFLTHMSKTQFAISPLHSRPTYWVLPISVSGTTVLPVAYIRGLRDTPTPLLNAPLIHPLPWDINEIKTQYTQAGPIVARSTHH